MLLCPAFGWRCCPSGRGPDPRLLSWSYRSHCIGCPKSLHYIGCPTDHPSAFQSPPGRFRSGCGLPARRSASGLSCRYGSVSRWALWNSAVGDSSSGLRFCASCGRRGRRDSRWAGRNRKRCDGDTWHRRRSANSRHPNRGAYRNRRQLYTDPIATKAGYSSCRGCASSSSRHIHCQRP